MTGSTQQIGPAPMAANRPGVRGASGAGRVHEIA